MVCVKCKTRLSEDDSVLACDNCTRLVHRDCSGLSVSEFRVMDLKAKRLLKYYCDDCQMGVKLFPKFIA
nr:unnamed protein product [Callosobruchus analis]